MGFVMRAMGWYGAVAPTGRGGFRLCRLARRAYPPEQWDRRHTTPHGLSLRLDLSTYPDVAMAFGLYELDTLRLLQKRLRPGSVFVDGGANIGYFTLHAAKLGATVHAFEPDPQNRARLEENLLANDLAERVTIHAAALSDQPGTLTLHHPADRSKNHGETSIHASLIDHAVTTEVPAVRLDDVVERADFIKLDIEGAELSALGGMRRLLSSQTPPDLVIEVNREACEAAGHSPGELFRFVRDCNGAYRCWWIGGRLRKLREPADVDMLPLAGNMLLRAGSRSSVPA